ncbi:MAG: HDIG domain-containing protein [Treponema sp.]|nr:HDIG domain-containing protein [Treponema sp.]
MKKDHNLSDILNIRGFWEKIRFYKLRRGPCIVIITAFIACTGIISAYMNFGAGYISDIGEFEAGRVAERDIIAEHPVSYVDTEATRLKIKARERMMPAVFKYSGPADADMYSKYDRFASLSLELFDAEVSLDAYKEAIQGEFPDFFPGETLDVLYSDENRDKFLNFGASTLEYLINQGIFHIPQAGLEPYNPDKLELLDPSGAKEERTQIKYSQVITLDNLDTAVNRYIREGSFTSNFAVIALGLIKPFIRENIFFSQLDTENMLEGIKGQIEPVVKHIETGKKVIRKGFIVSEEELDELKALNMSILQKDMRIIVGRIAIFILLGALLIFLGGKRIAIAGRPLHDAEIYLLTAISALYVIGGVLVKDLPFNSDYLPISIILPTALVVILPAILINARLATAYALALPLCGFLTGSFDTPALIFALISGMAGACVLRGVETRMDLVKAGIVIAAANCTAAIAILLVQRSGIGAYPLILFWSAFNGIASGMLVLGILPPLEKALDAATPFRLIELSDLNAPILKRLFSQAPGTYSHSLMVAALAEAACQEIGANSLLARVGAYYHDIGKMDQSEYFVENQTDYNKHDELTPRLSATVIRSHVKLGVEKARSLGLPKAVIDIIAEHHGNSLITWFYGEALKRDAHVNQEDFIYPGNPPRSRESAAVMLADIAEAAVRTLQKPTAARIEKFIQELFDTKIEHGQLSESEITFRDMETIKKTFVRVLAGHYHSRIEYPRLHKDPSPNPSDKFPVASNG